MPDCRNAGGRWSPADIPPTSCVGHPVDDKGKIPFVDTEAAPATRRSAHILASSSARLAADRPPTSSASLSGTNRGPGGLGLSPSDSRPLSDSWLAIGGKIFVGEVG
jgi:hypothetical protein